MTSDLKETVDLTDLSDLPETGCETKQENGCPRKVEWLSIWHCGRRPQLLCTHHKQKWVSETDRRARTSTTGYMRCSACYERFRSEDAVSALIRWEPV